MLQSLGKTHPRVKGKCCHCSIRLKTKSLVTFSGFSTVAQHCFNPLRSNVLAVIFARPK